MRLLSSLRQTPHHLEIINESSWIEDIFAHSCNVHCIELRLSKDNRKRCRTFAPSTNEILGGQCTHRLRNGIKVVM